jgi:hypothetical protein
MKLTDYKSGDVVEVLMYNPKTNLNEWREGTVLDVRMIYPRVGERHLPYPIIIVRTRRTYCKATPVYKFYDNVPVFINNTLEFYDKDNDEGFLHENTICLKV